MCRGAIKIAHWAFKVARYCATFVRDVVQQFRDGSCSAAHVPDNHSQLAYSLRFYGVSLRFAPTPQAKGKIERGHQFWQKRFPEMLGADAITTLAVANPLLDVLRRHPNAMEKHRETRCTPQAA